MSTKKFEGYIPTELIDSITNNKCILFVGAGLSSKVKRSNGKKLPNWQDFLEELYAYCLKKRIIFSVNPDDIKEMISKGNLIMSAQELQETISKKDFGDFINIVFRDRNVAPSKTHLLLPKIPFRSILTSNYDNLIEGAYALSNAGRIPNKFTQEDLLNISSPLRQEEFYIFKIHGDLERLSTITLSSRDYQKLLFRTPEYRQFIETLFSVYTVLFVGFGASDPDLDNVLDKLSTLFERTIDKHYILLPDNKFNFTEKKRLLLDKRLEVIEYVHDAEHSQVDSFIEELSGIFANTKKIKSESKKYDIFLSHSSKDEAIANRIVQMLKSSNYKVWDFRENLTIGTEWQKSLEVALNESRFMIFLITENYSQSKWLEKELSLGLLKQLEGKLNVIPIVMGDIKNINMPSDLASMIYLKLDVEFKNKDLIPLFRALKAEDE
ncbi:MAG: SIR2 family protein [Spirosoma sp.]|nr:SIR2 family protein [Spirosoma sp.]